MSAAEEKLDKLLDLLQDEKTLDALTAWFSVQTS
jgi:hypothetical protein